MKSQAKKVLEIIESSLPNPILEGLVDTITAGLKAGGFNDTAKVCGGGAFTFDSQEAVNFVNGLSSKEKRDTRDIVNSIHMRGQDLITLGQGAVTTQMIQSQIAPAMEKIGFKYAGIVGAGIYTMFFWNKK